jgi:hypothetical protein
VSRGTAIWYRRLLELGPLIAAGAALIASVFAAYLSYSVAHQGVRAQYVTLAIGMLKDPSNGGSSSTDPGLRVWAVQVLQTYSDVPLPTDVEARLKSGKIGLASEASVRTDAHGELSPGSSAPKAHVAQAQAGKEPE